MNFEALANLDFRVADRCDPLSAFRNYFHIPQKNGKEVIYLCGNSLGLMPKQTDVYISNALQQWQSHGVEAHFTTATPWVNYHEISKPILASLVGAKPSEVVAMGTLTSNLHNLLATFYRPTPKRFKILCEKGIFSSDRYALISHIEWHGFSPEETLIEVGNHHSISVPTPLSTQEIVEAIEEHQDSLALVFFAGVQYITGQFFDIKTIVQKAHQVGAYAGFDLAHAIGNVPLALHDWQVDFACWCSYKYLNASPGGVGGLFVHQNIQFLPTLKGWWGHNPQSRFNMPVHFSAEPGADAWQWSNAPIIPLAILQASLDIFQEANFEKLVQKSRKLTAFLESLLLQINQKFNRDVLQIITPSKVEERGCQLSVSFIEKGKLIYELLNQNGVICDWREPNVVRLAPVPLYNSFADVAQAVIILENILSQIIEH
ncbi:MAG: kynureninase [Cytophagales bacterium]|nr:kynureninase [Cytophagales bacterium]MDW8383819.1 kynureninase [Flammeovirgaceae bacterium]